MSGHDEICTRSRIKNAKFCRAGGFTQIYIHTYTCTCIVNCLEIPLVSIWH